MQNNLKNFRENKCLTQNAIADKTNVSTRNYQRYEYGKQTPNVYTAIKLAKILDTTVEELFPLTDKENGNSSKQH